MVTPIQTLRTGNQGAEEGADADAPSPDPRSIDVALRNAAEAKYEFFVSAGSTSDGGTDPCSDFAAANHDFDRCVNEVVPKAVLFEKQAGDVDAVDTRDILQGGLGDCYVLAPLASLANTAAGRAILHGAVVENKNGAGDVVNWTVTFHQPQRHWIGETTFREVHVTVDGPFVVGHAQIRGGGPQNEVWPLVIEKAYAEYSGGYNRVDRGGIPADVVTLLTGREATYTSLTFPNSLLQPYSADTLRSDLASGKIVIVSTKRGIGGDGGADSSKANPYRLIGGHAYFAEGIERHGGRQFVKLGNPWGAAEDALVPCDELTTWLSGVSVGSVR